MNAAPGYVGSKTYITLPVESGMYSVSFSSRCSLMLGHIHQDNVEELENLPNSISTNFTIIAKSSSFSNSFNSSISFSDKYYLVLFNNEASHCKYNSFSSQLMVHTLGIEAKPIILPYRIIVSFRNIHILGKGNSTMDMKYYSEARHEDPTSTSRLDPEYFYPLFAWPNYISSISIREAGSSDLYSYVYLYCDFAEGCPLQLSSNVNEIDDSSSAIIGGVVGPVLFLGVLCLIAIIILSTIIRRRKIMTLSKNYSTQSVYIQTPTSEKMMSVPQQPTAPDVPDSHFSQPSISYQQSSQALLQPQYYSIDVGICSPNILSRNNSAGV